MFFNSAASLSNLSGTTSTQVNTENCSEESNKPQNLQEPEKESRAESEVYDEEVDPSQVRFDRKKNRHHTSIYNIYSKFTSTRCILTQRK